jgi:hypothetical protein
MISISNFLRPSWKKVAWLFLVFFVGQLYFHVIMVYVPFQILQQFIAFILNPGSFLFEGAKNNYITIPIANTLNLMWQYVLATILAKEISKD